MSHKEMSIGLVGTDMDVNISRSRNHLLMLVLGAAAILIVTATILLTAPAELSKLSSRTGAAVNADAARWNAMGQRYGSQESAGEE